MLLVKHESLVPEEPPNVHISDQMSAREIELLCVLDLGILRVVSASKAAHYSVQHS
jgi:hypothetical protein